MEITAKELRELETKELLNVLEIGSRVLREKLIPFEKGTDDREFLLILLDLMAIKRVIDETLCELVEDKFKKKFKKES